MHMNEIPVPHFDCKYSEDGSTMALTYTLKYDYVHGFVPPHQHNDTGNTNANAVGSEMEHGRGAWTQVMRDQRTWWPCWSELDPYYTHGVVHPHQHVGRDMDHSPGSWTENFKDGRVVWFCTHPEGFKKLAMPMTETARRWTDGPKMWILEPKATAVTASGRRIRFDWEKSINKTKKRQYRYKNLPKHPEVIVYTEFTEKLGQARENAEWRYARSRRNRRLNGDPDETVG